jgi:hypothetical protein
MISQEKAATLQTADAWLNPLIRAYMETFMLTTAFLLEVRPRFRPQIAQSAALFILL